MGPPKTRLQRSIPPPLPCMRGAAAAADDETRCVKSGRRGEPAKRTAANYEASGRQGQAGKFLDQTRARSRKPPAARGEARRAAEQRSPRRARACAPANRNRAFLPLRPSGYGGWLEARGRPAARPTGGIASRGWCRREPRPAPPGTSRSRAPAGRPAPSALLSCRPASPRERTRARTARHTGHERTRVRGVVGADSGADRSISHVMSGGKRRGICLVPVCCFVALALAIPFCMRPVSLSLEPFLGWCRPRPQCGHAACRMHMLDFGSPFFCPSRVGRVALLGIK